jgi:hypothetical protein
MTAKLATGDDRIWAGVGEPGALRDGSILLHGTSDKPQLGSVQFGCGYLGQAKKITIDKNCTVIEGQTKYGRPFKPGTCDHRNSRLSFAASASRSICVSPE